MASAPCCLSELRHRDWEKLWRYILSQISRNLVTARWQKAREWQSINMPHIVTRAVCRDGKRLGEPHATHAAQASSFTSGPLQSSDGGNRQFSACWQLYTSRTNISLLILFGRKETFPRGMGGLMSLAEESSKKKDTNKCTDSLAWLLVSVAGFSEDPQWTPSSVAHMDNPFMTAPFIGFSYFFFT